MDLYDDVSLQSPLGPPDTAVFPTTFSAVAESPDRTHVPPAPSYPPSAGAAPFREAECPSVRLTMQRLEAFLFEQSPTLYDTLSPGVSAAGTAAAGAVPTGSLQRLERTIHPYRLPQAVRDAYMLHDGQDATAMGRDTGVFFGLDWLPLDEVRTEYLAWRDLERGAGTGVFGVAPPASVLGMTAFPTGWIRPVYSHPGWLPLATDRCGNYLGVDLDPPEAVPAQDTNTPAYDSAGEARPTPHWGPMAGQVIVFGRDMDEKVVLYPGANAWGRFLFSFAEMLERNTFATLSEAARPPAEDTTSDGDASDSSDSSDGLGDMSYLDGNRYGVEDGDSDDSRIGRATWIPTRRWRRWLRHEGLALSGTGILRALAEQSKRRWAEAGEAGGVAESATNNSRSVSPTPTTQITTQLELTTLSQEPSPTQSLALSQSASSSLPSSPPPLVTAIPLQDDPNITLTLSPPSPGSEGRPRSDSMETTTPQNVARFRRRNPRSSVERSRDFSGSSDISESEPLVEYQSPLLDTRQRSVAQPAPRRRPPPPVMPLDLPLGVFDQSGGDHAVINIPSTAASNSSLVSLMPVGARSTKNFASTLETV